MATKIGRLQALTADLSIRTSPPEADVQPAEASQDQAAQDVPSETRFPAVNVGGTGPRARTGPGQMLAFRSQMLESDGEIERLRSQLKQYDGSTPALKLDPSTIHRTKWANRDRRSFETDEFASLKSEIEAAGGNIQPILVRPSKEQGGHYEIVFGHRRLQACMELGIPVLALIAQVEMPDAQLFIAMDRENRERQDLSAFEQGRMYLQALEEGLFPSARQLADSLGVSGAWISKTTSVAKLLPPILEAFRSPLEIQPNQAKEIERAIEVDRKAVLKRAEKIRGQGLKAGAVTQFLVHGSQSGTAVEKISITSEGRKVGVCKRTPDGGATITFAPHTVDEGDIETLIGAFRQLLEQLRSAKQ